MELGYIPKLELGSGPALVLGAVRHWSSDARRHHRMGTTSNLRCGVKNNKALLKAENLKGLLGYPTCKLAECISAILKIKMRRFVEPVFKTVDRR